MCVQQLPATLGPLQGLGSFVGPHRTAILLSRLVPFRGRRGGEEGRTHPGLCSLIFHPSLLPPQWREVFPHLSGKTHSPQTFFLRITLAILQILSSPLRAFITQNTTQRSFSSLFCFLSCHIIPLPWGKGLLSKAWRWGRGIPRKKTFLNHMCITCNFSRSLWSEVSVSFSCN